MKWFILVGIIALAVAMYYVNDKKDINRVMKKVRAAKAKKAQERRDKITYTPPAKHEGGIMKVA